jgi:xylono-1,5-lactonase
MEAPLILVAVLLVDYMIQIKNNHSLKLPEGLLWNDENDCFDFVDIETGCFYQYFPFFDTISLQKSFETNVGWAFRTNSSNYIVGLKNEILIWNPISDEIKILVNISMSPTQRLNDAFFDDHGKLWFGVMSSDPEKEINDGYLCSFSKGQVLIEDFSYQIPNGPVLTQDKRNLLHSDSSKGILYRYPYQNGVINREEKKIILNVSDLNASPDGMCLDSSGCIYIAMWGIGEVWVLDPNFILKSKIKVPYKYVSNVAFGGKTLKDLVVTYAEDIHSGISGGLYRVPSVSASGLVQSAWKEQ